MTALAVRPAALEEGATPFPSMPVSAQQILSVEFSSPDGSTWSAVGGGPTLAAAVDFARACCPPGTTWQPVRWSELYGD
jgi:hypothetical protein